MKGEIKNKEGSSPLLKQPFKTKKFFKNKKKLREAIVFSEIIKKIY